MRVSTARSKASTRWINRLRLSTCTVCERQPVMTGESSVTRLRARSGRLLAASRLSRPPSEWPTSQAPWGAWASRKSPYLLADFQRFAPPLPAALAGHALLPLAVLMAFGLQFLAIAPHLDWLPGLIYAGLLVAQLALLSRLCERGQAGRGLRRCAPRAC